MKNIFMILTLLTIVFVSCGKENNQTSQNEQNNNTDTNSIKVDSTIVDNINFDSVILDTIDFLDTKINIEGWSIDSLVYKGNLPKTNDSINEGMYVSLTLIYPKHIPNVSSIEKIQKSIAKCFDYTKLSDSTDVSFNSAFQQMINTYNDQAIELASEIDGESSIALSDYYDLYEFEIFYANKNLLTMSAFYDKYYGGAHGVAGYSFYNIDLVAGETLRLSTILNQAGQDALANLIQEEVRRRTNLPNDDENNVSCIVDISEIKPTENYFYNKGYFVFFYNVYEITPYVYGPVIIAIPFEKIKPFIKDKYVSLFDSLDKF